MSKLNIEGSRNSFGFGSKPPPSPGAKRNSTLDFNTINSMFPDAAAAIAKQKAEYQEHTGNAPHSNRNSAIGDRSSQVGPRINTEDAMKAEVKSPLTPSPWNARPNENLNPLSRPKSSTGHQPMGQFSQAPQSAGLRSPRPLQITGDSNLQSTTLSAADANATAMGLLSPYHGSGNWASMVNTPMVSNFSNQQSANQADMVANATAMKLAALSTVNNRIQLDDARKYRRARSSEGQSPQTATNVGLPNHNILMTNELGQVLTPQQAAALQAQQLAAIQGRRSRPNSPGIALHSAGLGGMNMGMASNNGFLHAYDNNLLSAGLVGMNHNLGVGMQGEGYLSDHSEARGRSPRGRRGTSKPPEDPTDPALLNDIPGWLRTLRLHKYTDNLKEMKWQDLVQLDDEGLEKRGVNALGARRKLIKVCCITPSPLNHCTDATFRFLSKSGKHRVRASFESFNLSHFHAKFEIISSDGLVHEHAHLFRQGRLSMSIFRKMIVMRWRHCSARQIS